MKGLRRSTKTFEAPPCKKCNTTLRFERSRQCVQCTNDNYAKSIAKLSPEELKEKSEKGKVARRLLRLTLEGKAKDLLHNAKTRARKKNLPEVTLTPEWVIDKVQKAIEYYAKHDIQMGLDGDIHNKTNPYAPSLDQSVPRLSYTEENTRVVPFWINAAKGDYFSEKQLMDAQIKWVGAYFRAAKMTPEKILKLLGIECVITAVA
jgi:hypothetical protein